MNDEPETAENVEEGPTTNASPENEFENIVSPDLRDKIFDEISSRLGSDEDERNSFHDKEKEAEPEVEKRSSEVKKDEVRVRSIEVELSAEAEQKRREFDLGREVEVRAMKLLESLQYSFLLVDVLQPLLVAARSTFDQATRTATVRSPKDIS